MPKQNRIMTGKKERIRLGASKHAHYGYFYSPEVKSIICGPACTPGPRRGQIRDQIDQIAHFQLQSIVVSPSQDPLGLHLVLFLFAQRGGLGTHTSSLPDAPAAPRA